MHTIEKQADARPRGHVTCI